MAVMTPEDAAAWTRVLMDVAELDTFPSEIDGDPYCAFCDYAVTGLHEEDCTIRVARRLLVRAGREETARRRLMT